MAEYRFMKLVEENDGFEFCQAYRDEVDHILGGKGNTFWFVVMKNGKTRESCVGKLVDGVWEDTVEKGSGKTKKTKTMAPGYTIKRIEKAAYFMQNEPWVKDRKPKVIEDGCPHFHYTYGFGDKALDVSKDYGVTIAYSDLSDVPAGFHLRTLYTGNDVEA